MIGMKKKKEIKPMTEHGAKKIRTHNINTLLNDDEFNAFNRMIETCKVKNKSKWIREVIMRTVIDQLNENAPKLF